MPVGAVGPHSQRPAQARSSRLVPALLGLSSLLSEPETRFGGFLGRRRGAASSKLIVWQVRSWPFESSVRHRRIGYRGAAVPRRAGFITSGGELPAPIQDQTATPIAGGDHEGNRPTGNYLTTSGSGSVRRSRSTCARHAQSRPALIDAFTCCFGLRMRRVGSGKRRTV